MPDGRPHLPRLDLGLSDLAPDYDLVLCDVWGVIHNGMRAEPSAVDALVRFRKGGGLVVLVTNAPAPKAQVVARLDRLHVPRTAYDDIATSGDVTVARIVAAGCPPLFNIGPAGEIALYREAERIAGRPVARVGISNAQLAICIGLDDTGDHPDDYADTLRALRARDLELVCANPDIVVEVGDQLVWCAGAIAERYAEIGGRVVHAGKPFPAIYTRAFEMARMRRVDVSRERTLAIGDALRTDLTGARDEGLAALLVTGGIHRDEWHDATGAIREVDLEAALATAGITARAAQRALTWML